MTPTMRLRRAPPFAPRLLSKPRISPRRSPIELAMYVLLVASRTHQATIGEADQVVLVLESMSWACRRGSPVDDLPVLPLPETAPDGGGLDPQANEDADRRQQRDEQDALENDCAHDVPI